jgi:hypothetical protein
MTNETKYLVGFIRWMQVNSVPIPTTIQEAEQVAGKFAEYRRLMAFKKAIKSGATHRDLMDNVSRMKN